MFWLFDCTNGEKGGKEVEKIGKKIRHTLDEFVLLTTTKVSWGAVSPLCDHRADN